MIEARYQAENARYETVARGIPLQNEAEQRRQAMRRLMQIEKVNNILGSIFRDLNPRNAEKEGKPLTALLGERLDQATAPIEGEAIGDPLAVARMQMTLGESQLGLGYAQKAIDLFTKARTTFASRLGPDHPYTLTSMASLVHTYRAAGQVDRAVPLLEQTLALQKVKLGPDHPDTLTSMGNLARAYRAAGQLDQAVLLFREVSNGSQRLNGFDSPLYAGFLASLGHALLQQEKWADAEPVLRECLAIRERQGGQCLEDVQLQVAVRRSLAWAKEV